MRPVGFDKRSYTVRGTVLAILLVLAVASWHEWLRGRGGLVPPILSTIASALIIVFSEHKRYLLILSFGMLAALGI